MLHKWIKSFDNYLSKFVHDILELIRELFILSGFVVVDLLQAHSDSLQILIAFQQTQIKLDKKKVLLE